MKSDNPERLGNVYGEEFGTGYAGNVWDDNGLCPPLMTMQGGGRQPMVIEVRCLNSKGGRNGIDGLQPSLQDRVFDPNGCSFAMTTGYKPSIIETKIVAQRGRDPEKPSDRTSGNQNLEQRLEPCSGDWCNTITTVQKDNLVLEKSEVYPKEKYVGVRQATKDGVIPCVVGGGGRPQLPSKQNETGQSYRQRSHMPDTNMWGYP